MPETPIYVRIEDYRDVLDTVNLLKSKISDAKRILAEIQSLKNQEDTELEYWTNNIEEVERKLDFVDKTLFNPEI
ncbi:MAG TPA: hypothetical protein VI894_01755 [Candidatus Nanoarchaeia archaeon]|nr:hypothetical protein [Candidatus Nanoarchaeia archaeon]